MQRFCFASFALMLLITSCQRAENSAPNAGPLISELSLSGTVRDWADGEPVELFALSELGSTLGKGRISDDGSFNLTVSPPTELRSYANVYFKCEQKIIDTIELSNPDVGLIRLYTDFEGGTHDGIRLLDSADFPLRTRLADYRYLDAPLTIDGHLRCGDELPYVFTAIYNDVHLNAGWNLMVETPHYESGGNFDAVEYEAFPVDELPKGLNWYVFGSQYAR